jgi:hypothetical protein
MAVMNHHARQGAPRAVFSFTLCRVFFTQV